MRPPHRTKSFVPVAFVTRPALGNLLFDCSPCGPGVLEFTQCDLERPSSRLLAAQYDQLVFIAFLRLSL